MHRIDGPDVALSFPTPSAVGTPGYFRGATAGVRGTVVRKDWANAVQEEIVNVILGAGLSLDKTLQNQLDTAIDTLISNAAEIRAVISDTTDTGVDTTDHGRAIVACATSQATGAASVVAGSTGSFATGGPSFVGGGGVATASGDGSAVLGGTGEASGDFTMVGGCNGAVDCTGDGSAILACSDALVNAGGNAFMAACTADSGVGPTTTGGTAVAVLASDGAAAGMLVSGNRAAAIACGGGGGGATTVSGTNVAAVAVGGGLVNGEYSVLLASLAGTVAGDRCIVGAASGSAGVINAAATNCVLFGSTSGSGFGANAATSAILACNGVDIGDNASSVTSGAIASTHCDIDATNAFIAASVGDTANGDDVDVAGARSAILASSGGSSAKTLIASDCVEGFIAASRDVEIDATSGTGSRLAIIASTGPTINGATPENSAIIACRNTVFTEGSQCFAAACGDSTTTDVELDEDNCAAIGITGSARVNVANFVLLGSDFNNTDFNVSGQQTTPGIGGGDGNALTWRIDSNAGDMFINGAYSDTGADFAEMFENVEPGEIPVGRLVTRVGTKVRLAGKGDAVLGVVSKKPAFLGNESFDGRRKRDVKRWTCVALLGQVPVKVTEETAVDDLVTPLVEGVGAPLSTGYARRRHGRPVEVMAMIEPGLALCLVG